MMRIVDCSSCVQAVPGRPPSPWTALRDAALLRRAATAGCQRLGGSRACRRGYVHSGTGCTGSLTVWGPQSRLASSTSGPLSSATPLPHPRNVPPHTCSPRRMHARTSPLHAAAGVIELALRVIPEHLVRRLQLLEALAHRRLLALRPPMVAVRVQVLHALPVRLLDRV